MSHLWMKFYPSAWRADQALRVVSLAARGLWMEMLCIMHEATPYGHLVIGDQPVSNEVLARIAGTSPSEVQALLVELQSAQVLRLTRSGIVYSKRMCADYKRAVLGRKAKLEALRQASEDKEENPRPSRPPPRHPSRKRIDTRAKVEGPKEPSTLSGREGDGVRADGPPPPRAEIVDLGEVREELAADERNRDRETVRAGMLELAASLGRKVPA